MTFFNQQTIATNYWWVGFLLYTLIALAVDLFLFHKNKESTSLRRAIIFTSFWFLSAMTFAFLLFKNFGSEPALVFITGYLVEQSLSIDNLFVFVLIFQSMGVPKQYHHRVLFWGVIGAIFFRIIFILMGVAFISYFNWAFYIFGCILIYSAYKVITDNDGKLEHLRHPIVKIMFKYLPIKNSMHEKFFIKENKKYYATSLFVTVACVEVTDIIFAIDSIPAIFAITRDPFLIFTSNIFAIMGLRNLYFIVAEFIQRSHYINYALGSLLIFIGVKMLIFNFYHIPIAFSLGIIISIFIITAIAELTKSKAA